MLQKLMKCWLPWLLLVLTFIYFVAVPSKGLIGPIEIPADDAFLPEEDIQWWYWTGHLESEDGHKFGFEVVFFAFDDFIIFKDQLIQGAITDVTNDSFHFDEHVRYFSLPDQQKDGFNLSSGSDNKITAVGGNGKDTLHSEIGDYTLDLQLEETKKPVLHYGGDPHPYRFGGYTYYYSRVAMKTTGTITHKDKVYKVSGSSWFDRQYGQLNQTVLQGWKWFAIEMDDDHQIMLFNITGKENASESYASITDPQGKTRNLGPEDFTITDLGEWKSPHTGCTYPSGWKINIEDKEWIVEPMVKDQELRAKHTFWVGPEYWEGSNYVNAPDGTQIGKAYVELNGFCREIFTP